MLILVFIVSGLGQRVYKVGFVLLMGLVLVGTVLQELIVMIILSLTGYPVDWLTSLTYVVAPTIFYNLVFIWPVYWFVRRLQRRIYGHDPTFLGQP